MTKEQMREELSRHGYDTGRWESYDSMRQRLSEARRGKRQHYASWNRIFKSVRSQ